METENVKVEVYKVIVDKKQTELKTCKNVICIIMTI